MIAATEDELNEHISHSVLNDIKQKLMVIDLIDQLDIANGLKGLLIEGSIIMKRVIINCKKRIVDSIIGRHTPPSGLRFVLGENTLYRI